MKSNFDILLIVILLFTLILLFIVHGGYLGAIWLFTLEGIIAITIIILLVRYFRARK